MSQFLHYKNYTGSVNFSEEDGCLFGSVQGIRSLISYEGQSVEDLIKDFHNSVDEYLKCCEHYGDEPEKPFKGSFNVRIDPELHRKASILATEEGISLNKFIENAVKRAAMLYPINKIIT